MNKKFLKFFSKLFSKPIVQVGFYILGILVIFLISGVFDDFKTSVSKIINILSAQETISVFLAGILSLGMARIIKKCDYYLEESLKIDDDHHKIIRQYAGHPKQDIATDDNFYDKNGVFMCINHTKKIHKNELKNREKDKFSKVYKANQEDITYFNQQKLYMPSVNVFANILGDTKIVFNDSSESHKLPSFVIEHADELLMAHKNSTTRNNNTIRLNDFTYADKTLTFNTKRSTYYHMLITNRCMDYDFANGLSIRKLYEYDKTICPLHKSKFGNQIGINGLIITSDGYVLVEKRDHQKTTWKNKFAQSISLALKEDEVKLNEHGVIGNAYEDAAASLEQVITKTLKNNFGLTKADYKKFVLEKNFLGLARDLLEGGKPNLYFYVEANYTAKDFVKRLKEAAGYIPEENTKEKADSGETLAKTPDNAAEDTPTVIATEKLDSDYYLIKFSDIKINYHYVMNVDRKKAIKVPRKVYPRVDLKTYVWDTVKYACSRTFTPKLQRECGEALLATISYLELCKDRIEPLKHTEGVMKDR